MDYRILGPLEALDGERQLPLGGARQRAVLALLLFVVANMTKQSLMSIVREATPFIFVAIVVLVIITFVPQTVLWLPRVMGYKG